jgi:hypothetical protein
MHSGYFHFVKEVYSYCDNNIGQKILFPAFTNLWDENGEENTHISKKDLAIIASKIVTRLLERKILNVIPKDGKSYNPYGFYKILEHKNLMHYTDLTEKKMKTLKL